MQKKNDIGRNRRALLWLARASGFVFVLLLMVVGFWFRGALYNRFVHYPREEAAWRAFRSQRVMVPELPGWQQFRGILHSHSELSHDCEVPFEEILQVLKSTGIDFICLSDHCVDGRADFDLQWRGVHDGKLFVPGFEMRNGFMPFGVAPGVVLTNGTEPGVLASNIVANGGVLFYAHPEEPRDWALPELTGMEIYNIHVDFKAYKGGATRLLPDVILNLGRYPEHIYWSAFRRPGPFLQRWDELNRTRHITGIAANDCHQNVGLRAFCTFTNTIRIEDTSPQPLKELKLNWFTRTLARVLFGRLEPGRKLFHVQLDPYERSGQFVNTHVLARELSETAILDSLRVGRAFVGFDVLADSAGFAWSATNSNGLAVMGESATLTGDTRLLARSPIPCRFTLIKDGTTIQQSEGRTADWTPTGAGKYRVEAELKVLDKWVPWVYANPIHLQ